MCRNITVLHLCHENCSCLLKVKILCQQLKIMPMKISGTHVSKKSYHFRIFLFCMACSWKTAIEIVLFTTFVERAAIGIIQPKEFLFTTSYKACSLGSESVLYCLEHNALNYFCFVRRARVCVCVSLLQVSDKYVIHWVRLCSRSCAPVLKTECTVFPKTDRPQADE